MLTGDPTIVVHLAPEDWSRDLADAARRSLADEPPWIEPVWFYDQRGSELFDEITRLPEYYPTRAERALLERHAAEIAALGLGAVVELGSGTSDKTRVLLDAMAATGGLGRYVGFDVSEETLRSAVVDLCARYPGVTVEGVVGDFHRHLGEIPGDGGRLVAFLGSTIGNLRPHERRRFLFDLDCALDRTDRLLLGIDLVKDPSRLVAAYDDAAGVTAAFNRNALTVLNRELGTDFDPALFEHVALWDAENSWIEMRLRATEPTEVKVPGLTSSVTFATGDDIRTEISAKFTVDAMVDELWSSGFVVERSWIAPGDEFALLLAQPYC
jgi:L-histidine N-alpha-methyltransferase